MRLIDADALKKVLSEPLYRSTIKDYGEILKYTFVMDIIDNAPTVEPGTKVVANVTFDKEQLEELVEKAKADILAQIERPQGEWKKERKYYYDFLKNIIYECSCSVCGARFPFAQIPETIEDAFYSFDYCPSCGAEMKGGAE